MIYIKTPCPIYEYNVSIVKMTKNVYTIIIQRFHIKITKSIGLIITVRSGLRENWETYLSKFYYMTALLNLHANATYNCLELFYILFLSLVQFQKYSRREETRGDAYFICLLCVLFACLVCT